MKPWILGLLLAALVVILRGSLAPAAAQAPLCPAGSTVSQAGRLDVTTGAEFAGHPLEAARDGDPATFYCYSDGGTACESPGPGGPGMQLATAAEIVAVSAEAAGGCSIATTVIEAAPPPYRARIIFFCLNEGPFELAEFHFCLAEPEPVSADSYRVYLPLVRQ